MKLTKFIPLTLSALCAIASCKKSGGPVHPHTPSTGDTDVYVAGFVAAINPVAAIWKNGIETKLAETGKISYANAIAVSGNDVYAAGSVSNDNASFPMAVYWKNGLLVKLSDNLPHSSANAIAVIGNDVYVAGSVNYVATMWKNGVATRLDPGNISEAFGLAVSGGDVYVSGYVYQGGTGSTPTYWKNGVEHNLNIDNDASVAYAVAVSGNNIYLAGNENGYATLWKNGLPGILDNNTPAGDKFGLAINNNEVYAVSSNIPAYWKNGAKTIIPGYGFPDAIAFAGSDMYIAGAVPDGSPAANVCYWKNGVLHEFGDGGNGAGIAVVVR